MKFFVIALSLLLPVSAVLAQEKAVSTDTTVAQAVNLNAPVSPYGGTTSPSEAPSGSTMDTKKPLVVPAELDPAKQLPPSLSEIRSTKVVSQWEGKYWREVSCISGKRVDVKEGVFYLYERLETGHTVVWRVKEDRKKLATPAFVVSPDMKRQYWYWTSKDGPANVFPFISDESAWTTLNGVNANKEKMSTGGYYSSKTEETQAQNGVLRKRVVQKYPHSTSAMWDIEMSILLKDSGEWYVVNKKHSGYFSSGECADLYSFNLLEEVKK